MSELLSIVFDAPTDPVLHLFGVGVLFLILLSIRRRREAIRHFLGSLMVMGLTYFVTTSFLTRNGRTPTESVAGGVIAALLVNALFPGKGPSRDISRSVRRKVVERFESTTGQKYNRRAHEIDHVVPFSKGGSSTKDNLRVVSRRENRSKGAKSPWWDLLSG